MDLLRDDHWEVYKNIREFERGHRDRAVWADGRELVIEFADGSRLIARADKRLDISIT